jgi:hypothetical protein
MRTNTRKDGWTQQVSQMLCRDTNAPINNANFTRAHDFNTTGLKDILSLTNKVIAYNRFMFKKLTATELVKKRPAFCLTDIPEIFFSYTKCKWTDVFKIGRSVNFLLPCLTSFDEFFWGTHSV